MNVDARDAVLGLLDLGMAPGAGFGEGRTHHQLQHQQHLGYGHSTTTTTATATVPMKRKRSSTVTVLPQLPPVLAYEEEEEEELPAPAAPVQDDSIRCICGFTFDDGFSIACDDCSRWCHAACFEIVPGEVPEEWRCWECVPLVVDRERAIRMQKGRLRKMEEARREAVRRKGSPGVERKGRKGEGTGGHGQVGAGGGGHGHGHGGKKKRRMSTAAHPPSTATATAISSIPAVATAPVSVAASASTQPPGTNEDEHVDIDEPWTHAYVPLAADHIPHPDTRAKLRRHAQHWRGVTALSSSPDPTHPTHPVLLPLDPTPSTKIAVLPLPEPASVRPPAYAVHTTHPVPSKRLIAPYTSCITPSASYLADPLNAYAHLGMPKPFVHLVGPPLDVALDARVAGGEGRFVRSGCRPNAVLRPVLCAKDGKGKGGEHGREREGEEEDALTFGIFALRDLKANEEVVLGWEWDDGNVVHSLPALIESPHLFPVPFSSPHEMHSPHARTHLRHQMANILHLLASTFTTCACGNKARNCALTQMEDFVDEEGVFAPPPASTPEPMTMAELYDSGTYDVIASPSHFPDPAAHYNAVPLPTPVAGPSTLPDVGPLVGVRRRFRTRERVPFAGGMCGVEMVTEDEEDEEEGPMDVDGEVRVVGKGKGKQKGKQKGKVFGGIGRERERGRTREREKERRRKKDKGGRGKRQERAVEEDEDEHGALDSPSLHRHQHRQQRVPHPNYEFDPDQTEDEEEGMLIDGGVDRLRHVRLLLVDGEEEVEGEENGHRDRASFVDGETTPPSPPMEEKMPPKMRKRAWTRKPIVQVDTSVLSRDEESGVRAEASTPDYSPPTVPPPPASVSISSPMSVALPPPSPPSPPPSTSPAPKLPTISEQVPPLPPSASSPAFIPAPDPTLTLTSPTMRFAQLSLLSPLVLAPTKAMQRGAVRHLGAEKPKSQEGPRTRIQEDEETAVQGYAPQPDEASPQLRWRAFTRVEQEALGIEEGKAGEEPETGKDVDAGYFPSRSQDMAAQDGEAKNGLSIDAEFEVAPTSREADIMVEPSSRELGSRALPSLSTWHESPSHLSSTIEVVIMDEGKSVLLAEEGSEVCAAADATAMDIDEDAQHNMDTPAILSTSVCQDFSESSTPRSGIISLVPPSQENHVTRLYPSLLHSPPPARFLPPEIPSPSSPLSAAPSSPPNPSSPLSSMSTISSPAHSGYADVHALEQDEGADAHEKHNEVDYGTDGTDDTVPWRPSPLSAHNLTLPPSSAALAQVIRTSSSPLVPAHSHSPPRIIIRTPSSPLPSPSSSLASSPFQKKGSLSPTTSRTPAYPGSPQSSSPFCAATHDGDVCLTAQTRAAIWECSSLPLPQDSAPRGSTPRSRELTPSRALSCSPREATPPHCASSPPLLSLPCDPAPPPHKPTPPPPPPPKIKMSLRDFALRKKKMREELSKSMEASPMSTYSALASEGEGEGTRKAEEKIDEGRVDKQKVRDGEGENRMDAGVAGKKKVVEEAKGVNSVGGQDAIVNGASLQANSMGGDTDMSDETAPEALLPVSSKSNGIHPSPLVSSTMHNSKVTRTPSPPPSIPPPKTVIASDTSSREAKLETIEHSIPTDPILHSTVVAESSLSSQSPPIPILVKSNDFSTPSTPLLSDMRSPVARPLREDGEIREAPPPQPGRPYRAPYLPRTSPPTQPRSFQTPGSSLASSSPGLGRHTLASFRSTPPTLLNSSSSAPLTPSSRPVPSAPRALRNSALLSQTAQQLQQPAYAVPPRPLSGTQYIPRGPSADRDRQDWERSDRWQYRSRARGGAGWGR